MRSSLAVALAVALAAPAFAQASADQSVRVYATDVSAISVTDASVDIALDEVVAGDLYGTATSGMSVTSNILTYKITGQLDADYPDGAELSVLLDFTGVTLPIGLTVNPVRQTLSATVAKDLVVGLTPLTTTDIVVDYQASAPLAVGTDYDETNTVTYTVTSTVGL